MIPVEVENRIAKYFFWTYLPEGIIDQIEDKLLPTCIRMEKEGLDYDELVRWAIDVIEEQLEDKRLK